MADPRPWNDPDENAAYVQRSRQSWDRILAARQTATRQQAISVSTMAASFPHMRPGTIMPLVQAGVTPDDQLTQRVALEEAKSNKRKRGFMGAIGDIAGAITSIPATAGEFAISNVLNPVGGAALGGLKTIARPGLAALAAPFEVGTGVLRNVAAAGGEIVAGAASGAAVGAGIGGFFGGIGALPGVAVGAIAGGIAGVGAGAAAQARGVNIESEGFVNPLEQSTLFQSFGAGGLGKGYMPGGDAAQKAAEAARRSAAISGHALTPGRFLASAVVEEGTAPYNLLSGALDASVAWRLDPAAAAGKGLSRWRKAQRTFTATDKEIAAAAKAADRIDAGLVEGSRKTVISEKVDAWLGTERGQRAMQWFADADFESIRTQLGGNRVDVGTVRDLANAKTMEEVDVILRPQLGIKAGLEMKPRVGGFGMEVKRLGNSLPFYEKMKDSRLFANLPSGRIDYSDPTEATHQFNLLLRDANLSTEDAARWTEEFAGHLIEGSFEARRAADDVAYRALGGAHGKVAEADTTMNFMNKLARRAAAGDSTVLRSLIDEDVTKTPSTRVSIDGTTVGMPPGGYLADYFDNGFDVSRQTLRDIRATTSKYARVVANSKFQTSTAAMTKMTDDIWKPAALLRGAWTVRVVGEEQIRLAASGRLSLFNHPLSYLAWAMDDGGRISNVFKKHGIDVGGRGSVDITGQRFAREGTTIESAANDLEADLLDLGDDFASGSGYKQQAEGWYGNDFTAAGHRERYARGQRGHVEAVAENIDQAASDPLMRELATRPRHEVKTWFTTGEGNELRQALIKRHGATLKTDADIERALDNASRTLDKIMGRVDEAGAVPARGLTAGGMSTTEVAQLHAARRAGRPGSPAIRQAIATGEINGVAVRLPNGKVNPDFMAELKKLDDLPDEIVGSASHVPTKRWDAKRDKAVQTMYTNLMSRPSAKLSRSPMFRQTYWGEAENLITELDPAAQQRLLASAKKARLDSTAYKRLEQRAKASAGELSLDEADLLLKGRALDETQRLLYDAAQRGQLSDVLRIVMPFAEAQKEVMGTWAKLGLVDNMAVTRRAQQTLSAARGSGFFYKDPGTGEEMFTFPGSEFLTEKTLGMPIPLTGRVAGLNTFGSGIIPGLGPAVQIPVRYILPDKPQFDDLRKFVDPFGSSAEEDEGILEGQFPGWLKSAKRAFDADDSDRVFANAVKDTWAQGVSAGRYKTDTPDAIREGLDHAKSTARWLYVFKGLSSVLGAPTPPSPAFMAMDKDGKWHMAKALSEDYRKMIDDPAIGFEGANAAFVEKYGSNAAVFMQSKSYATVPTAPTTGEFREWTRSGDAQALAEKYEDVFALFGPQGEGFDYTQYLRNIESGATETLTPEQFAERTNHRQAQMVYYNFKDRFGPAPSKEQREWLSQLREKLRERFPGYDVPLPGAIDKKKVTQQFIPQVERAVKDPALEGNEVAIATRAYLTLRQQATQAAEAAGYGSFDQAKGAAPLRDWLRQILDKLVERTPDFAPMAERVFDREMTDDASPETVAAGAVTV